MRTWAETTRANVEKLLAADEIEERNAAILLAMADFCAKHDAIPTRGTINLWGFGEASALFEPADGGKGWWTPLFDLIDPLAMTSAQLLDAFKEDVAEEWGEIRADTITFPADDGEPYPLKVVSHSFVLMLLAGKSPWSRTFVDNSMDLFRHAALRTGLADSIGGVIVFDSDGNAVQTDLTVGDMLRGKDDLPSEEVARHQAFTGPTGPLERGEL